METIFRLHLLTFAFKKVLLLKMLFICRSLDYFIYSALSNRYLRGKRALCSLLLHLRLINMYIKWHLKKVAADAAPSFLVDTRVASILKSSSYCHKWSDLNLPPPRCCDSNYTSYTDRINSYVTVFICMSMLPAHLPGWQALISLLQLRGQNCHLN